MNICIRTEPANNISTRIKNQRCEHPIMRATQIQTQENAAKNLSIYKNIQCQTNNKAWRDTTRPSICDMRILNYYISGLSQNRFFSRQVVRWGQEATFHWQALLRDRGWVGVFSGERNGRCSQGKRGAGRSRRRA